MSALQAAVFVLFGLMIGGIAGNLIGQKAERDRLIYAAAPIPSGTALVAFSRSLCVAGHLWWNPREMECFEEDAPR